MSHEHNPLDSIFNKAEEQMGTDAYEANVSHIRAMGNAANAHAKAVAVRSQALMMVVTLSIIIGAIPVAVVMWKWAIRA